jgi:hypothetical protein
MYHKTIFEPDGSTTKWESRDGKKWVMKEHVEPYRKLTYNGKPIQERRIK